MEKVAVTLLTTACCTSAPTTATAARRWRSTPPTGEVVWHFWGAPGPGELGNDTWEGDVLADRRRHPVDASGARPRARPGLLDVRQRAGQPLVAGRLAARRHEPVLQLDRRDGPADRAVPLALPVHPSRHLGHGQLHGPGPGRRADPRTACASSWSTAASPACTSSSTAPTARRRWASTRSRCRRTPRQKTWPTQPFPRQGAWTEHRVVDQPLGTAVPGDPNRADHASIARHGWRRRTSARSPGSCRSRHPVWP